MVADILSATAVIALSLMLIVAYECIDLIRRNNQTDGEDNEQD